MSASESARRESARTCLIESRSARSESELTLTESASLSESASSSLNTPRARTASSVRGPYGAGTRGVGALDVAVEQVLGVAGGAKARAHLVGGHSRLLDALAELLDELRLGPEEVLRLLRRGQLLACAGNLGRTPASRTRAG